MTHVAVFLWQGLMQVFLISVLGGAVIILKVWYVIIPFSCCICSFLNVVHNCLQLVLYDFFFML